MSKKEDFHRFDTMSFKRHKNHCLIIFIIINIINVYNKTTRTTYYLYHRQVPSRCERSFNKKKETKMST